MAKTARKRLERLGNMGVKSAPKKGIQIVLNTVIML